MFGRGRAGLVVVVALACAAPANAATGDLRIEVLSNRADVFRVLVKISAVRRGHRVTLRSRHTYRLCIARRPR